MPLTRRQQLEDIIKKSDLYKGSDAVKESDRIPGRKDELGLDDPAKNRMHTLFLDAWVAILDDLTRRPDSAMSPRQKEKSLVALQKSSSAGKLDYGLKIEKELKANGGQSLNLVPSTIYDRVEKPARQTSIPGTDLLQDAYNTYFTSRLMESLSGKIKELPESQKLELAKEAKWNTRVDALRIGFLVSKVPSLPHDMHR